MNSYIKQMRSKLGHEKFIHPGARIIVENSKNQVLFIERKDTESLGIPAGSMEDGETIEECIIREVYEETGLMLVNLEVIGISSNPLKETTTYPKGDTIQYFTIEFYSQNWEGSIKIHDKEEVTGASFKNFNCWLDLPENEQSAFKSLAYYRANGKIMLK